MDEYNRLKAPAAAKISPGTLRWFTESSLGGIFICGNHPISVSRITIEHHMTDAELRRLRGYYKSLSAQARTLAGLNNQQPEEVVDMTYFIAIKRVIDPLLREFPGIVPQLISGDVFSHDAGNGAYFRLQSLMLYLDQVVGRLEVELEEDSGSPVTQKREFLYIADKDLQALLRRDYQEVQRAFVAQCWKATIVLAGGAMEAILLDRLSSDRESSVSAASAPKQADLKRWQLSELIEVAVELKLVNSSIEKFSHSVREYRNLIHPGNEVRNKLAVGAEEARIAIEILNLLDRELGK
jgi:hypothetical protein